jgi:hypothetical protein
LRAEGVWIANAGAACVSLTSPPSIGAFKAKGGPAFIERQAGRRSSPCLPTHLRLLLVSRPHAQPPLYFRHRVALLLFFLFVVH